MTFPIDPTLQVETPRSQWTWVGTAGGVLLGTVFLFGAFGKMIDPVGFAELLTLDGLDFLIPSEALVYVALTLEIGIGLALVLGIRHPVVLVPAVFVVALFLFLTGRHYVDSFGGTPASHGCGCFGNLVQRSPGEAFWQDLAMLVPTLGLSFVGRPAAATPLPVTRTGIAGGVTAVALAFTAVAPSLPIDDFATKLVTGLRVTEMCAGEEGGQICLETVVPELAEGDHIVLMADISDPAIYVPLNEYVTASEGPLLWVLSPLSQRRVDEILDDMLWDRAIEPLFAVVHAPAAVIRPLYRSLPRAFLVQAGEVTRTWAGMPDLSEWMGAEFPTNR